MLGSSLKISLLICMKNRVSDQNYIIFFLSNRLD